MRFSEFVIDPPPAARDNPPMTRPRSVLVPLSACLVLASCSLPRTEPAPPPAASPADAGASAPTPEAAAVVQQSGAMTAADAKRLQSQVMDFADDLTVRLAEAMDKVEENSPSVESRVIAHRLKYTVAQGATVIAASTNPRIAMVDMLVMISLQRALVERNIAPAHFGPEGDAIRAVFDSAEREIRGLAAGTLTADQLAEVDRLIARWLEENPDRKFAAYVRLSDFSAARQAVVQAQQGRPSNVFGFLFIDPLSGLDPTTRELEQTRLFAERAFFYLQRMPVLISWQAELLFIDTVSEPETREVLAVMQRVSESVADLTAQVESIRADLPEMIAAERAAAIEQAGGIIDTQRQAAIDQAIAGLRAEREALIGQIADEQARLAPMLTELREATDSATTLSESVRETTKAFSDLMTRLRVDGPKDPDAEPFDITEYTAMMRETTAAASELTRLTESLTGATDPEVLEARLALVERRIADAESAVDRVLGKAFRLGAVLIVMLSLGLAGVVVLAAVLRRRG